MLLPKRKLLAHEPPSWARAEEAVFFITVCCAPNGLSQLCQPGLGKPFSSRSNFDKRGAIGEFICCC
jgi:hypothetical protein